MIENTSLEELVSEIELIVKQVIKDMEFADRHKSNKPLTRVEAKKLLNVSFVTLNKWNKLGILPAFSVGTRIYYKWDDIEEAMKRVA